MFVGVVMKHSIVLLIALILTNEALAQSFTVPNSGDRRDSDDRPAPTLVTLSYGDTWSSLSLTSPSQSDTAQKNDSPQNLTQIANKLFRPQNNKVTQNHITWIYDARVKLREDNDLDGYFQRFELTFDVDTSLRQSRVYAVVYLGDESSFREIHRSVVFDVTGETSADEYTLDNTLKSGFHANDYDVLIELFDADTNQLIDRYDHTHDADLSLLSLESQEFQKHSNTRNTRDSSAGALGIFLALPLLGLLLFRRGL